MGATVLLVAPFGRDAILMQQRLGQAGIESATVPTLEHAAAAVTSETGAIVVSEEALSDAGVAQLLEVIAAQPEWSDLPVLILTAASSARVRPRGDAVAVLESAANVTLLDRPVQTRTLVRASLAALRARQRQYDLRDVLDRERATREQVEAVSRAKDEFLATVSHELRTPLNAILGWARLLRSGDLPVARVDRALATIERNARAQAELIEDLLDGSRIVAGTLALVEGPVDLGEIVSAALDVIRPAAESRGITLAARVAPRVTVHGDARRLSQIMSNLLGNAVKFTDSGGRIDVTLRAGSPHHEIVVADTGIGIAPEFLPHVFERFRQSDGSTTRVHGGLGLGLAIVRSLVELHGGTVTGESPGIGRGATFTVTLPAATAETVPAVVEPSVAGGSAGDAPRAGVVFRSREAPAAPLSAVRVLVVDDDPDTRELIVAILRAQGASAIAVASARAALASFAAERPDVVVSDIGMPNEDGYMLVRQVRALESGGDGHTPVIALTAYARDSDRDRATDAGFDMHLTKPLVPSELVSAIARAVGR